MTYDEAKVFISGFFKTFNEQDWKTFFSKYVWEDCLFINANGAHKGKEKMLSFWNKMVLDTKKEKLLEPTNILIKDNQIVAEVPIEMYFKEDTIYAGLFFKKGSKFIIQCADFYKFKNGKISEFKVYRLSEWWLKSWEGKISEYEKLVN